MPVPRFELSSNGLLAARTCLEHRTPATEASGIRAIAARSAAFADELRRVQNTIVNGMDWQLWTGKARDEFHAKLESNAPVLRHTISRYESYAGALNSYACTLEWIGPTLQRIQSELRWGIAAAEQSVASQRFRTEQPAGPLRFPMAQQLIADAPGDAFAQQLHPELLDPARRFKTAYDQWADAVAHCSAALLQANSHDPLHDPHGLSVVRRSLAPIIDPIGNVIVHPTSAKAWSDALSAVGSSLTLIGVVVLAVCPPVGLAILAAAAVVGAMQLAVDGYRMARGEHGVTWWTIGMDAVSALPFGAVTRSAKVAGQLGMRQIGSGLRRGEVRLFASRFLHQVWHAGRVKFAEDVAPVIGKAEKVPRDLYRSARHEGGADGLAKRWAKPLLWDGPNAVLQWPSRKDTRGTPERAFDSAKSTTRQFNGRLILNLQPGAIR